MATTYRCDGVATVELVPGRELTDLGPKTLVKVVNTRTVDRESLGLLLGLDGAILHRHLEGTGGTGCHDFVVHDGQAAPYK